MNMRTTRKEKKLTQEELAVKLGVDQTSVSKWEQKKSIPRIDTMYKLAEVLEVSVSEIMSYFYTKPKEIEV